MNIKRETVVRALVGSHNYNLNNERSDKDYKMFVMPTFEDLYKGKMYQKSIISQEEDVDVHDLRKIPNLFWKANINFLEVLFSVDVGVNVKYEEFWDELVENRECIATANLPYLYNACVGMSMNKRANMDKYSESMEYSRRFGYNVKEAAHAYRLLNFLERYEKCENFEASIWYPEDSSGAVIRLIREGVFSRKEMERILDRAEARVVEMKTWYYAKEVDKEVWKWLDRTVMELIKKEITWWKEESEI